MTAHQVYYPKHMLRLFTDSQGDYWVWNPVLSIVDHVPKGKQRALHTYALAFNQNNIEGALKLALRKVGITPFLPNFRQGHLALMI